MLGDSSFRVKFDGAMAERHAISMKQLGSSLIGLEGLVSLGLISLSNLRLPKKREAVPLVVVAREPRPGSVEIYGDLAPAVGLLPLVNEAISTGSREIIWRWLSWALLMDGGKEQEADPHFLALMELMKMQTDQRGVSEREMREFMLEILDRTYRHTERMVAPVGPSADTLSIGPPGRPAQTEIDVPTAEVIRSNGKITVGAMTEMAIKVDGIIHHSRQIKVENPEEQGKYLTCYVRDPVFEKAPNIYTDAAVSRSWLYATVKPSRNSDGRLVNLYIMDAKRIDS